MSRRRYGDAGSRERFRAYIHGYPFRQPGLSPFTRDFHDDVSVRVVVYRHQPREYLLDIHGQPGLPGIANTQPPAWPDPQYVDIRAASTKGTVSQSETPGLGGHLNDGARLLAESADAHELDALAHRDFRP